MSRMTIGAKLLASFAAVLFVALDLAGGYLYSVRSLAGALHTATDITAKKILLAADLQAQLFRMRSCQRGVMLFMLEQLPAKAQSNKQEFDTRAAGVTQILAQIKPLLTLERGQRDLAALESESPRFTCYFEQVQAAALAGDTQGALKVYTDSSSKSLDSLEAAALDLVELQETNLAKGSEQGARDVSQAHWLNYILFFAAI